jgi:dTDP-4-dehydrorhamnose 3,5-epimerase
LTEMTCSLFRFLSDGVDRRTDERGYLEILYERDEVVLKRSFSKRGVFRGMHWQRHPHDQTKLIRVISGRILDFVVDPESAGRDLEYREFTPADGWVEISSHLAHGFYALEDTDFEYLCHGAYNEAAESTYSIVDFLRNDIGLAEIVLSAKDSAAPPLKVFRQLGVR